MNGELDDLDSSVVTRVHRDVGHGELGQANGTRVRVLAGAEDLERSGQRERHVLRAAVRAVATEAHVDVNEGSCMTLEPAGLEGNGTAGGRPIGAVCRHGCTTA